MIKVKAIRTQDVGSKRFYTHFLDRLEKTWQWTWEGTGHSKGTTLIYHCVLHRKEKHIRTVVHPPMNQFSQQDASKIRFRITQ